MNTTTPPLTPRNIPVETLKTRELTENTLAWMLHYSRVLLASEYNAREHGSAPRKVSLVPCGDCTACCENQPTPVRLSQHEVDGGRYALEQNTDGTVGMMRKDDGSCYALRDGKCSIYSVRPQACRVFDCRTVAYSLTACGDGDPERDQRIFGQWQFRKPEVCEGEGEDDPASAKELQTMELLAGASLVAAVLDVHASQHDPQRHAFERDVEGIAHTAMDIVIAMMKRQDTASAMALQQLIGFEDMGEAMRAAHDLAVAWGWLVKPEEGDGGGGDGEGVPGHRRAGDPA